MATSEPLVPTGLPHGERQQVRAQMQEAGVPLAPPSGGSVTSLPVARPAPPTSGSPSTADQVARFDALAGREPQFPAGVAAVKPPSPVDLYRAEAEASGNAVAVEIAQRIAKYMPGN